jgi:hypothetical protein
VAVVDGELGRMRECCFAPTANRSVVGVLNEFALLADVYRRNDRDLDLLHLARRLASTPCGPLSRRHVSPDRELEAFLRSSSPWAAELAGYARPRANHRGRNAVRRAAVSPQGARQAIEVVSQPTFAYRWAHRWVVT